MKKLQKLVLHKTTPLTIPQMKNITGGYEFGGDYPDGSRPYRYCSYWSNKLNKREQTKCSGDIEYCYAFIEDLGGQEVGCTVLISCDSYDDGGGYQ